MRRNLPLILELIAAISPTMTRNAGELTEELEGFLDITPEDVDDSRAPDTAHRQPGKSPTTTPFCPLQYAAPDLDALPKGEQNVLKLIIAWTLVAEKVSPSVIWKPC